MTVLTHGAPAIEQLSGDRVSELRTLVRVSLVLRLFTLLASMFGFVGQELTPVALGAIIFLALTSMAGLSSSQATVVLSRHPILAIVDILVITGLMLVLGVENPLVLATLSSSVIIGVLLAPLPAALCTVVLVGGYVVAASDAERSSFVTLLALPLTFMSVVVMGQAFRVVGERKRQSERAFADLVSGAAAAQERSRLARELHDSTAKTLQGLALGARSLSIWIEREPARALTHAEDIAVSAEEAIVQLRTLLSTLRQDDPDLPFDQTLQTLARDLGQQHGVKVRCELEAVPVSEPGVRYELLAAVREALVNAAVHSGQSVVDLSLAAQGPDVVITVHDAGKGFDPAILPQRELDGHFGVRGYTERLAVVGGHAEVDSHVGKGTTVRLSAPLAGLRETAQ